MRALTVFLLVVGSAVAQDSAPAHLAETIYKGRVEKARERYEEELQAARQELKERLEAASKNATKNGDLDKAVAYRDKAKAIELVPAVAPLLGRYDFHYANNTSHQYLFTDEKVGYVGQPKGAQPILWRSHGGDSIGVVTWPTSDTAFAVEVFLVGKDATVLHYPGATVIRGVGTRIK